MNRALLWGICWSPAFAAFSLLLIFLIFRIEPNGGYLAGFALAVTHGLFIACVTQIASGSSWRKLVTWRTLISGVVLALPIFVFGCLDSEADDFFCADGERLQSSVPPLPWLWIGWVILAVFSLPGRVMAKLNGRNFRMLWTRRKLTILIASAIIIAVLGFPFQIRNTDCSAPYDRVSFGLMEGGLLTIPVYGAFWLAMSISLALLSASETEAAA